MKVDFDQLGKETRIWIYQSNQEISPDLIDAIQADVEAFVNGWSAHQQPLAAFGSVFHRRFIVLMVDETFTKASGCSIDTSVAFIRKLEEDYDLILFDRMTFSYLLGNIIHTVPKDQFAKLYADGVINEDTLVFDNLIKTKSEWENWKKPLGESWLKRFV
ncbi:MAG: hypothetical protein HKN87_00345 [Saprospiraceae bacterium]|nr:hypothetical protein [Saprospiraceae bacterium]